MRILIIRHADPDYEKDSLTEKGWREARLLADKFEKIKLNKVYCSTMGRAKDTASIILENKGLRADYCDWLREFPSRINRPDNTQMRKVAWDWLPQDWTQVPDFFERKLWYENGIMKEAGVDEKYNEVTDSLDNVLVGNGYRRDGLIYRAEHGNRDTIAFFCHFGVECVMLSHLMNVSPMILWHHTCAAPSSVTSLYTEERRKGIVSFRMNYYGDISHLYAGNEEPSFQARFCETWEDMDERHD